MPPDLARRAATALAAGRCVLGLSGLLAPRWLARRLFSPADPAPATVSVLRMFAGRDLALGLGALLGARERDSALRRWTEAGVVADAADVVAFAAGRRAMGSRRYPAAVVAAGAVATGLWAARRLAAG